MRPGAGGSEWGRVVSGGHGARVCVSDMLSCRGGTEVFIMVPRLRKDRWANEAGTVPGRVVDAEPVSPRSWWTLRGSRRLSADVPDAVLPPSGPVSGRSALPLPSRRAREELLPGCPVCPSHSLFWSPRYHSLPRFRRTLCRVWKSSRSTRFQKLPLKCLTDWMQVAFERCFLDASHHTTR